MPVGGVPNIGDPTIAPEPPRAQSGFAGLVVEGFVLVGSDVLFVDVVRSDIMAFAETWFL